MKILQICQQVIYMLCLQSQKTMGKNNFIKTCATTHALQTHIYILTLASLSNLFLHLVQCYIV